MIATPQQGAIGREPVDDFTIEIAPIGKVAETRGVAFWRPSSPISEPMVEWSVTGKAVADPVRTPKPVRAQARPRGWYETGFWLPEGKKAGQFKLTLTVRDALGREAEATASVERGGAFKEIDELLPGAFVVTLPANRLLKKVVKAAYGTPKVPDHGFYDGHARYAAFSDPYDVAVDRSDAIYVTDLGNDRIRKILRAGR